MEHLYNKFFSDPDWGIVEKMLLEYVDKLIDINDIDLTQPAEEVKAQIIARTIAYNEINKFLSDTKIVGRPLQTVRTPFK